MSATLPVVAKASLPASYERAKEALATCSSVDECKDWADKAAALASYAKQADDDSLQRYAERIRARAIRKCGELLKQIERGPGKPPKQNGGDAPTITRASAARDAGLSRDQKITALRVASVPEADFEAAVEADEPPTITELAERGKKPQPRPLLDLKGRDPEEFKASTYAQGAVERMAACARQVSPTVVVRGAFPDERRELQAHAVAIVTWLEELLRDLEET